MAPVRATGAILFRSAFESKAASRIGRCPSYFYPFMLEQRTILVLVIDKKRQSSYLGKIGGIG
jgi:hypothetical protein